MTDKTSHSTTRHTTPAKHTAPPKHVENTTDAHRGEPLALRAQKRKLELEAALEKLPADELRARNDIEIVVASINALLTGDPEHLADTTAADLSRLLESNKHLAETVPVSKSRART